MHRIALAALVMLACRPRVTADPPPPFEHHRDDYVSREYRPVGVANDLAAQLVVAGARSPATQRVTLDERMAVIADEVAERSATGRVVALPEMFQIARESGSLLFPLQATALDPAQLADGWADAVIAAIPGRGPLAIGTSTPREGAPVVVVFARSLVRLPAPVPSAGTTRLEIELDPQASASTPTLLLIDAHGTTELAMQGAGELRFAAELPEGFGGHRIGILGVTKSPDIGQSRNTTSELLASLDLGAQPRLGPPKVGTLPDGLIALREQWQRPPIAYAEGEAAPCGSNVLTIGGAPVTLVQRCVMWASSGSDAARWSAMLVNPLALAALADPRFGVAEVRRDPSATTVRFAQRFEELTEAEAVARVHELVRARFPGITHDAAADAATAVLAKAWSSEPLDDASVKKHADLTAEAAARWSTQPRWFRATWSNQDLAGALEGVAPDAKPVSYTLGVVRGVGPQGEPRWFMVLLLSLPAV